MLHKMSSEKNQKLFLDLLSFVDNGVGWKHFLQKLKDNAIFNFQKAMTGIYTPGELVFVDGRQFQNLTNFV